MSRIRTVKPAFFRSLTIAELGVPTRLTFIGLWTYVDDDGRGVDDSRLIKSELWPLDDDHTKADVEGDMDSLANHGLIERYKVAGRSYFWIPSWTEHQVINHSKRSSLPAPDSFREDSGNDPGTLSEPSVLKGKERKGREAQNRSASLAPFETDFDEMWKDYPRKVDKAKALKAYTARRRAGAPTGDLLRAATNYAETVTGNDPQFVKHCATFFGPDEPWREYVNPPPDAPDAVNTIGGKYDPEKMWAG
jgi:hypothetical protein